MPDQLQNELVKRAMARDAQQKIGPLDPQTQSVPTQRDDPFSSPDLMYTMMANAADPANIGLPGEAAAAAVTDEGAGGLVRFMIDFYKKRIQNEPWVTGHPGLNQVPEFKKALEELGKRTVPESFVTNTTKLRGAPAPPSAAAAQDVADVARTAQPQAKAPRTALSGKWANTSGVNRDSSSTLTEDGVRKVRDLAKQGLNATQIADQMGMHKATIGAILNGDSWYWVK